MISAMHDSAWIGAARVEQLVAHPADGDYLFCAQFDELVAASQAFNLEIYVFTQFMRPLLTVDFPIETLAGGAVSIIGDGVHSGLALESPVVVETSVKC